MTGEYLETAFIEFGSSYPGAPGLFMLPGLDAAVLSSIPSVILIDDHIIESGNVNLNEPSVDAYAGMRGGSPSRLVVASPRDVIQFARRV